MEDGWFCKFCGKKIKKPKRYRKGYDLCQCPSCGSLGRESEFKPLRMVKV